MTPQQLLAEFGHIASAPNGVQRLREMVLQLAVLGALSEQNPEDGQASALIEFAAKKKREAVERRLFKSSSKLESLAIEVPRTIILPPNWGWVRLLDLGEINPRNDCDDELDVSFLPMGVISQSHRGPLLPEKRKWSELKKGFTHVADGDVILAKITPCFENGKSAVVKGLTNGFGAGTTELHVFRAMPDIVDIGYVYVFLRSPHFSLVGEAYMTGTAGQKRLPTEYFASRAMPFPPLAEQKRIVAKVDELMALCDKLEALQNQRKAARALLTKEILGRVASDATVDAQTRLQNLSLLASDVDQIPVLRQTILSLAVQGKLVPQEPGDDEISIYLDLVRPNDWQPLDKARAATFSRVPISWRLVELHTLLISGPTNGYSPKAVEHETPVRSLTLSATTTGRFNQDCVKFIDERIPDDSDLWLQDGDILIQRGNSIEYVGVPAIFRGESKRFIYPDLMMRIRLQPGLDIPYVHLAMSSVACRDFLRARASGTSGSMPKINQATLRQLPIPLPPLAEQKRIVTKVDQLMALCDTLEAKLRKASEVQEQLAISAIAALTGIQTQEKETMKTPKTELVARLRLGTMPSTRDHAPLASLLVRHNNELSPNALLQHSSLGIDGFYRQLKLEMTRGWIVQPEVPSMKVEEHR